MPVGTVGEITLALLVTGLASYSNATTDALLGGILSVANNGAPAGAPLTTADVSLEASNYAASISLTLQGACHASACGALRWRRRSRTVPDASSYGTP